MSNNFKPPIFIHRLADVEAGAIIGDGSKIWRWTHVMDGAVIGKNVSIGQGCFIASTARIGDDCRIQNGVSLWDGVQLEDKVFVGPNVVFTNVKKPKAYKRGKFETTLVKEGATIGANATILCVTIGKNAVIGAGSIVTKDVPDDTMVWGNPAKIQRYTWLGKNGQNSEEGE
jgi:UDP-2-acetamido-3-amino-2,3-dideoxy-glucuronate N-acetyltransferase